MIRIYKHYMVPASLSKKASWTEEDVLNQLKSDQCGKCYLCERILITDFEVEHHKSRDNFPALTYEWSNLFWACGYCNRKKSSSFDNLLNPIVDNIEDIIFQKLDFPNAKAVFSCAELQSEETEDSITFLRRIFNGTKDGRTLREQDFYNYAVSRITSFQEKILAWLDSKSKEAEMAIIEELDVRSEFLGFKYWIIKSNESLFNNFGNYIKWHKT